MQAEVVPPPEIAPIIDVIRKREDVAALGEFSRVKLSGRTGAAPFRGEELDHRGSRRGRSEFRYGDDRGEHE